MKTLWNAAQFTRAVVGMKPLGLEEGESCESGDYRGCGVCGLLLPSSRFPLAEPGEDEICYGCQDEYN